MALRWDKVDGDWIQRGWLPDGRPAANINGNSGGPFTVWLTPWASGERDGVLLRGYESREAAREAVEEYVAERM